MSDFVLGEQIEQHEGTVETMSKALTGSNKSLFIHRRWPARHLCRRWSNALCRGIR